MFKNTKVFPLKEFWEQKLNIKYDTELEYYKKLCGLPYKYEMLDSNPDLYNRLEDITYGNWKSHILKNIKNCTINELEEYSRFLNQQYRNWDTQFTLFQTIFAPLIFYFVTICFSPIVSSLNIFGENSNNLVIYLIFLFGVTILFVSLLIRLLSSKKDQVIKNFYKDIKEIVDERINLIKTNTAEEQQ